MGVQIKDLANKIVPRLVKKKRLLGVKVAATLFEGGGQFRNVKNK